MHSFLDRLQHGYDLEKAVPSRFQLFQIDSMSEDAECYVQFDCIFDLQRQLFYVQLKPDLVKPAVEEGEEEASPLAGGRVPKRAVLTLLDVAEALGSQRIYIAIDPKHPTFAALVRMFLYLGFTMKSSRSSSKLLSGKSVVLEYDISWSAENEANSSEAEDSAGAASTTDRDESGNDDDDSDDDEILDESADIAPTPPFTYRAE